MTIKTRKPRRKPKHKSRTSKAYASARNGTSKQSASKKGLPNPNDPREIALSLMKKGLSQRAAAKSAGVSNQRLARYRKASTSSRKKGRKWIIKDRRPAEMHVATGGKIARIAIPYKYKSTVGHHWNAINEFLTDNNTKYLSPYAGRVIRDIDGKKYLLETGPNTLRMLDAIGELDFLQIYANTAR